MFKFFCILLLVIQNLYSENGFADGTGTEQDPFKIVTAEHLDNIRNYTGSEHRSTHFLMDSDINLGISPWNKGWQPVGFFINDSAYESFEGIFDGNNKTISNLYINDTSRCAGLFVILKGTVKNLILDSVNIQGNRYVGSLCAIIDSGFVDNCSVTGTISGHYKCGGLIGESRYSIIIQSYSSALVEGGNYIGGFIGMNLKSEIKNCYSENDLNGWGHYNGGFVGNNNDGYINNCFSLSNTTGDSRVGGFVGENVNGLIFQCHSICNVSGNNDIGGFAGGNFHDGNDTLKTYTPFVDSCYFEGSVELTNNGNSSAGGFIGYNAGSVSRCHSSCSVNGTDACGGFAGLNSGTIQICSTSAIVEGIRYVGGFIGHNSGTILHSNSDGNVMGNSTTGGFAGLNGLDIEYCYSESDVIGGKTTGGFIGQSGYGIIKKCYSTGSVSGTERTGGFAGDIRNVQLCFSTGDVTGTDVVGGFSGNSWYCSNCYSTGSITASGDYYGGFSGRIHYQGEFKSVYSTGKLNLPDSIRFGHEALIVDCYYEIGSSLFYSREDGIPLSTEEMGKKISFQSWDFDSIWTIKENETYPYFQWQQKPMSHNFLPSTNLSKSILQPKKNNNLSEISFIKNKLQIPTGLTVSHKVYTLNGKLLSSGILYGPVSFSLKRTLDLPSGIYILKLITTDISGILKIRID